MIDSIDARLDMDYQLVSGKIAVEICICAKDVSTLYPGLVGTVASLNVYIRCGEFERVSLILLLGIPCYVGQVL